MRDKDEASRRLSCSMLVSLTRLRLNSWTHLFKFMKISNASIQQARTDANCLAGATYMGPGLTFWTATVWTDEAAMKAYVRSGSHREAMPWLAKLCSEATTTHYESADVKVPEKAVVLSKMIEAAKFFRVEKPSQAQDAKLVPPKAPWLINNFK